jgi:hypothetical protein
MTEFKPQYCQKKQERKERMFRSSWYSRNKFGRGQCVRNGNCKPLNSIENIENDQHRPGDVAEL